MSSNYGINITNRLGGVGIDANYANLVKLTTYTLPRGFHTIKVSNPATMLCVAKGGVARILNHVLVGAEHQYSIFVHPLTGSSVRIRVYGVITGRKEDTHGFAVYDPAGNLTYSSEYTPLNATDEFYENFTERRAHVQGHYTNLTPVIERMGYKVIGYGSSPNTTCVFPNVRTNQVFTGTWLSLHGFHATITCNSQKNIGGGMGMNDFASARVCTGLDTQGHLVFYTERELQVVGRSTSFWPEDQFLVEAAWIGKLLTISPIV